jgi:hypothetical protein
VVIDGVVEIRVEGLRWLARPTGLETHDLVGVGGHTDLLKGTPSLTLHCTSNRSQSCWSSLDCVAMFFDSDSICFDYATSSVVTLGSEAPAIFAERVK